MSVVVLFLYTSKLKPLGRRVIVKSRKLILDPPISRVKSIDGNLLFNIISSDIIIIGINQFLILPIIIGIVIKKIIITA